MAEEELTIITLRNDFFRDGYQKTVIILMILVAAIILLSSTSLYLFLAKPAPVIFPVYKDWRILPDVPLNQEYINHADLVQWVSTALPIALSYDFINYPQQLTRAQQYFNATGWAKLQQQLNIFINYGTLQSNKLWVNAALGGAATIVDQGLLPDHRYAWRIQLPINLQYVSYNVNYTSPVQVTALIVRVSTLNNLDGISIEDVTISSINSGRSMNG